MYNEYSEGVGFLFLTHEPLIFVCFNIFHFSIPIKDHGRYSLSGSSIDLDLSISLGKVQFNISFISYLVKF